MSWQRLARKRRNWSSTRSSRSEPGLRYLYFRLDWSSQRCRYHARKRRRDGPLGLGRVHARRTGKRTSLHLDQFWSLSFRDVRHAQHGQKGRACEQRSRTTWIEWPWTDADQYRAFCDGGTGKSRRCTRVGARGEPGGWAVNTSSGPTDLRELSACRSSRQPLWTIRGHDLFDGGRHRAWRRARTEHRTADSKHADVHSQRATSTCSSGRDRRAIHRRRRSRAGLS